MTREYTVVLTPEPEGGYTMTAPALPEYVGFAETEEEALRLAQEGIQFHVESLVEEGQPVPQEVNAPVVVKLKVAA